MRYSLALLALLSTAAYAEDLSMQTLHACVQEEKALKQSLLDTFKAADNGGRWYPVFVAFDRYDDWMQNDGLGKCMKR
ncbi:MAG TPA: hypothetical protein VMR46_03060 [Candidatus Paceibacterota bacterium]|nr:hypothetical protein [Candidatus Paceibacterota bacterium]